MGFLARLSALFRLGTTEPVVVQPSIGTRRRRSALDPIPTARTRWYLSDLERATHLAAQGDLTLYAQLYRACRRDGVFAGLLSTRTAGLISLPKRFYGNAEVVARLQSKTHGRSVFDQMFPPAELAMLVADGIMIGVGIAELVPVKGDDGEEVQPPVLRRMDPEFLYWNWGEGMWYYRSLAGPIPIVPGNGRWVLYIPGGTGAPWQDGLVDACGRAYIVKAQAISMRQNYASKLANPARVAYYPNGSNDDERTGFFKRLMAWGINTVFGLPGGWDVKLLESNGRGYEVWQNEEDSANHDFMIALAGQEVTTTGGTGFANADIHQAIRSDLIKLTGESLSWTLNTQALWPWLESEYGEDAAETYQATVEWDCTPPKNKMAEAQTLTQVAGAVKSLTEAATANGLQIDVAAIFSQYGVPVRGDENGDGQPELASVTQLKPVSEEAGRAAA